MPKLVESENQQKNRAFRAECLKRMELMRLNMKNIEKVLNVTAVTARKKMNDPGCMTVLEMRQICRFLKIEDEEKIHFI